MSGVSGTMKLFSSLVRPSVHPHKYTHTYPLPMFFIFKLLFFIVGEFFFSFFFLSIFFFSLSPLGCHNQHGGLFIWLYPKGRKKRKKDYCSFRTSSSGPPIISIRIEICGDGNFESLGSLAA